MSYTPFLVGATALHWDGFALNQRDWWAWWMACWGLCVLAYLTNPTAATFRTHLTSLSFHTHLRRLSSPSATRPSSTAQGTTLKRPSAPSHILSFSNRISLAVRTPPFTLRSYYLFSTVLMAPPPRTPSLLRGSKKAGDAVEEGKEPAFKEAEGGELWVGAFGRWYAWSWESEEMDEEERRARLAKGVVGMEVEDDEDNEVPSSSASATSPDTDLSNPPLSPTSRNPRNSRPTKRVFRGGQRRPPSPTSLARLRSKAETSASALPTSPPPPSSPSTASGHARTESEGEGFYLTRSTKDKGLPGLPFHVARSSHPPLPGHFHTDPPLPPPEPADPVLDELKTQLDELKTSTDEGEKRLHVELEGLRERKKEEDAFRAELKSKTKGLEETKRVAELNRVEAERELGERKAVMKRAGERVEKLRDEIGAIERREMEVVERKEKKKKERKEREKKLKEDVGKKREELKVAEVGIDKLLAKVAGLEKTIDARRDMLLNRRNDFAARSMGFGPGSMMMGGGIGMGMPGGVNMFRRAPGPGGYNQSMPNSRPGSVRSGHFDHHAAQYDHSAFDPTQSTPSSPTHSPSYPISADDESPYAEAAFYSGGFAPDGYRPAPLVQQGFLEHRIQHRRTELPTRHSDDSSTFAPLVSTLPSVDDIPASFLPFDFESHDRPHEDAHTTTKPNRPQLSLPLQYLDSGLLENSTSPGLEGPLSPVTPHQTSLIPRQLFQMLDEDDEDDFVLAHQHSPTRGRGSAPWNGLGLDLDDDDEVEDGQRREQSMSPKSTDSLPSPRFDLASHALGSGPWDASDEQLLFANRMSPLEPDDLPRHGLSLNPDAKAFAFQPRSTSSPSPTPRTINSPSITSHGVISPPAKSRMEFANSANSSSGTGSVAPASRFSYDWQRTSPRNPATMVSAFNPFDDDDELLGPLKK